MRQYWTEERLNSAVDRDLLVREGEPEPQPFDAASDFTPLDAPGIIKIILLLFHLLLNLLFFFFFVCFFPS